MKKLIFLISLIFLSVLLPAQEPPPPTEVTPSTGFFQSLIDFANDIWEALVCSLKKIMAWFVSLVENIFFYLLDIASQALIGIIILVFDLLPAISIDFNPLVPYYKTINYFFPFTETLAIYSALLTFNIGYTVVRWILKISPFIGG